MQQTFKVKCQVPVSMLSIPVSVVFNLAAIALEKQCQYADASNLPSMILETMPESVVWPWSDIVADLLRPRVERHQTLRPGRTGKLMPVRPA